MGIKFADNYKVYPRCGILLGEREDTGTDQRDDAGSWSERDHTDYGHLTTGFAMTLWQGLVWRLRPESVRVMSDVWEQWTYADVWNPLQQKVISVLIREGLHAEADATPEVQSRCVAWSEGQRQGANFRSRERSYDDHQQVVQERRARGVERGRWVKVVRGRKVPLGTAGVVFWTGLDSYGKPKVGISPSGTKLGVGYPDAIWTAASNCLPENPRDGFC